MNARQKAKKLKKENDLMREIIEDTPAMRELYDAYNKPTFVIHTTMHFQEYRSKRMVPKYLTDASGLMPIPMTGVEEMIEYTKQALAEELLEGIKENITYEVDDEDIAPTITASIFIGRK